MPSVPSMSFNVRFDLTSAPTLVLTDATTYPVGAIGIFTITQPDGYVRTGNFSSPDISSSGGTLSTSLRLSSTGGVQCGTYIIKYEIKTTDDVISTFTREFIFTYVPVSLNLKENFDVFTPSLSYSDMTSYGVNNYSNIAPTRSWTAISTPTGTKTSNTSTISLQHNGEYYDAEYTITLASTLTYQHTTYAWLSVLETVSKTVVAEACTPEPLEDIVAMMETLRQNSINCAGDLPVFEKAQSLFSHLMDQVKMAILNNIPQDGIYDTYEDLMAILRNSQPCVHTNLPIDPYDLGDYAVSPYPIDLSYCDLIGDGYNTSYTVNHNLNDDCVIVQVYESATGAQVLCDITVSDNNNVVASFYTAPTTDQYKVVVYAGARGQVGPGVAAGGTTGQYLRKTSNSDFATYWDTISTGDIPNLDMSQITTGNLAWSRVSGTPTSLAGYGITDPVVLTSGSYANPVWLTSLAWSKLTSTPNSLSGYGITDPVVLTSGSYSNPSWLTALAWSKITGAPAFLTIETDPVFTAHPAFGITGTKISNWDAAYSWVNSFPSQSGNTGKFLTTNGSVLSWADVVSGVSSFNTRTGAVTLNSTDVTTALGYTPYNSSNPSAYISGITSGMVTTALGYTPVTNARTLTINGTAYDLSADRSWTVSSTNIYSSDGTLTGNRIVDLGGNKLMFHNLGIDGNVRFNTNSTTNFGNQGALMIGNPANNGALSFGFSTIYFNGANGHHFTIATGLNDVTPTTLFQVRNTGNVLINTVSDTGLYKLDVNGTARVSGNLLIEKNQNAATNFTISNTTNNANAKPELAFIGSLGGVFTIGKNSNTYGGSVIYVAKDNYFYTNTGDYAFLNQDAAGKMKWAMGNASTAQMTLTAAGRLLLGTTSESTNILEVSGTTRLGGDTRITGETTIDNNFYITGSGSVRTIFVTAYTAGLRLSASSSIGNFDLFKGFGYAQMSSINEVIRYISPSHLFGGTTYVSSALVNIESTTQGFLPPRMTEAQKNAISSPASGLIIYQTDGVEGLYIRTSTTWRTLIMA